MKKGERIQVWDDGNINLIGWGTIIAIAFDIGNRKEIPLIQLESGKKIWGDKCFWIPEKKAKEIGLRIFQDITKKA